MLPVLQAILSGILVGGVYGLLSIGLSLAFGVMRIVNFSHGDLVMYGMYVGVLASGVFGLDPLYVIPLSFLITALIGVLQYRLVFRRFVGHATLNQLLASFGLALIFQILAQFVFGVDTHGARSFFSGKYTVLGPLFLSDAQIVAFVVAVVFAVTVELLLHGTRWGKSVRAVSDSLEAAELVGLNSQTINITAFALSCGLAGIAGTVLVTYFPVQPSVGLTLMPIAIIATNIGGLGSIAGAFVGGIFCGVIQEVTSTLWDATMQDVPLYVLLLVFIAYRPTGIFGSRTH